jgi:hypothetical protein
MMLTLPSCGGGGTSALATLHGNDALSPPNLPKAISYVASASASAAPA